MPDWRVRFDRGATRTHLGLLELVLRRSAEEVDGGDRLRLGDAREELLDGLERVGKQVDPGDGVGLILAEQTEALEVFDLRGAEELLLDLDLRYAGVVLNERLAIGHVRVRRLVARLGLGLLVRDLRLDVLHLRVAARLALGRLRFRRHRLARRHDEDVERVDLLLGLVVAGLPLVAVEVAAVEGAEGMRVDELGEAGNRVLAVERALVAQSLDRELGHAHAHRTERPRDVEQVAEGRRHLGPDERVRVEEAVVEEVEEVADLSPDLRRIRALVGVRLAELTTELFDDRADDLDHGVAHLVGLVRQNERTERRRTSASSSFCNEAICLCTSRGAETAILAMNSE